MEMLEGIVLSQTIYKENSKIIKILNNQEIHSFLVRNSCKYTSKNFAYSQELTKINYDFHKSNHNAFDILTTGQVVNTYQNIKNDYYRLEVTVKIIALICKHGDFVSNYQNLYDLLTIILDKIDTCDNKYILLYECIFNLKFLYLIGYGPKFSSCVLCGNTPEFFSIKDGGSVCKSCAKSNFYDEDINIILKYLYLIKLDILKEIDFSSLEVDILKYQNVIKDVINKYYIYHVN